jgi:hypothetical protein
MLTNAMRLALVLCVLAACYHDAAPAPVASPPASAPRVRAAPSDPLGYLPVDSEVVVSLDAGQLRASGLWKTLEPVMSAKAGDGLARLRAQCSVDPLRSIKQVVMGFKGLEDAAGPSGVVVVRGLDRNVLMACMDRLVEANPRITFANGVVAVQAAPGSHPGAFTFANASTLVLMIGPTASPEQLAAVIRSGAPLRGSPMFVELLGQIQTRSTAWFALNGNAKLFDKMSALGFRPTAITGSVELANGFTGAVRVRLDSEDSARNLVALGQAQLGTVKQLAEEIALTADGTDVVLRIVMSQGQLEALTGIFGAFTAGP